ncbi:MAG: hypothetical protein K9L78_02335 [Victivallales bacterium]|nr:hypothetical protein [Victivallales bacterium]
MNDETNEIQCSFFLQHENKIQSLTREINAHEKAGEKKTFAEELIEETELLLNCEEFDENEFDCINCHTISTLRKRTAGLISKVGML